MVVVTYGPKLHDERPVAETPQRRGREKRTFEAVGAPFREHTPGRQSRLAVRLLVVDDLIIEKALDRIGLSESGREAKRRSVQDAEF